MQQSQQNSSIQPGRLANKNGEIRFHWPVKEFSRLVDLLYQDSGQVSVTIHGFYDHRKRCLLKADIKADLTLECQTTFEPIAFALERTTTYCTVSDESQFAEVEEEYEPILVEDGLLDVRQMIEDELILCVPVVANKSADEIDQKMSFGELDEAAIAEAEKASNPFSVLSNLKKT